MLIWKEIYGKSKTLDKRKIVLNLNKYLLKLFINGNKYKKEILKLREKMKFMKKEFNKLQIN